MGITTFLDYPPSRGLLWMSLTDTGRWLVRGTASDSGGGVLDHYQLLTTAGTYIPGTVHGTVIYWTEAQLGTYSWSSTRNVNCRIDALIGEEGALAGRISDRSTHLVTFAASAATISLDNDLQIQNRGRYEVTAIREHTNEFATQVEVTDRT